MQIGFRAQILSPVQTWEISDGWLITPESKRVAFDRIMAARFSDGAFRGRFSIFFDLMTPDEMITIWCEDRLGGQDRRHCFVLLFAVLERLKSHNPELLVQRGPGVKTRSLMMAIGLIPAFSNLVFFVVTIKEGDYLSAIAIGLFSLLIAAFIIRGIAPGHEPPALTLEEFEVWLRDQKRI
ncbi:MAG: hypothetical protein ACFB16_17415 [Phormidesmis sp.]